MSHRGDQSKYSLCRLSIRALLFCSIATILFTSCSTFVDGVTGSEKLIVKIFGAGDSIRYIITERRDSQQGKMTPEQKRIKLEYLNQEIMNDVDWVLSKIPAEIEFVADKKNPVYLKVDTMEIGAGTRLQVFRSNNLVLDVELKKNILLGYQMFRF